MSLIKDSDNNSSTIDDNDMFALSFANNSINLLDSNNNDDFIHQDFIMDLDTTTDNNNATIITPKVNFITGGFENHDVTTNFNKNEIEFKNENSNNNILSSSKGSYENIIDSYANVAQQNYRLWLSSF
ncbi:similar to Saccharomyces cerevisiae YMR195W ICY1 Protein of unknown function, required for viability in rich media of cells lacking mitochondrial DNA [Maudiozyma saulgeensis]|uniref:Uncharacterized protein n=1 Tax=Maudiozyma saulgeensis TaxID=1789683 RepID=A0A1X7R0L8_9SACH|nr:similar to Saccharomyces cerevisiae YMR195W ICY1 Protein of unknown function, required for viability in rich media of cells lacking mitochondrial DNA [Kazachstania saulgeensis]